MEGKAAEKSSPAIGPLVLALAKTYHWAGLYGTNHPILAKRVSEMHGALLARLSHEPEGRLFLGIARDKVLYRNEFLGEGQELVLRLTESLYLRQVATVEIDSDITPEGLLALFRYLHEPQGDDAAVPVEQFLRENGIAGIFLSPYNYKELLSRRLAEPDAEGARSEKRQEELWRLLLTADFTDKGDEKKIMDDLLHTPTLLSAILKRAKESESKGTSPSAEKTEVSGEVLRNVVGRLSGFIRALPKDRKNQVLSMMGTALGGADPEGTGAGVGAADLLLSRTLAEGQTDEEFIDLLASLVSLEGKGGNRLRKAFAILAADRNTGNALLSRVGERVRESRRIKDYYAQKTWEAVEKLILSRAEDQYLQEDHRRFLDDLSALRGIYLARIGKKTVADPEVRNALGEAELRRKNILVLLELLRSEQKEEDLLDLLADFRKIIPNLISLKDFGLLHTVLTSLETISEAIRPEWRPAIREALLETDFGQMADISLSGEIAAEDAERIQDLLTRFGGGSAKPLLDRLLHEPEAGRRRALIRLLGKLGPAAVPDVMERLSNPKWYFVRNVCTVLGEIGDRRAVEALMQATAHPDHRVRREAILAIGKLGGPEAVPGLGKILAEESIFSSAKDDQIRIDAASALFRIGGTEAIAFLHRGKAARRSSVRSHCTRLLSTLMEAQ